MKRMGDELGFDIKLMTYVARHSFAAVLVRSGAPMNSQVKAWDIKVLQPQKNILLALIRMLRQSMQKRLLNF
jgi:hypothetical protein